MEFIRHENIEVILVQRQQAFFFFFWKGEKIYWHAKRYGRWYDHILMSRKYSDLDHLLSHPVSQYKHWLLYLNYQFQWGMIAGTRYMKHDNRYQIHVAFCFCNCRNISIVSHMCQELIMEGIFVHFGQCSGQPKVLNDWSQNHLARIVCSKHIQSRSCQMHILNWLSGYAYSIGYGSMRSARVSLLTLQHWTVLPLGLQH